MAERFSARGRLLLRALRTTVVAVGLSVFGGGVALAQSAAPIVYKSASPAGQTRLENRVDSLALTVAPRAPAPSFASQAFSDSPLDLRPGAPAMSFGPTPLAAAGTGEPLGLKVASTSTRSAALEQLATPYAGPPYQVNGRWYVPAHEPNYDEVGTASWYGPTFHGKASASGETFDENALTAAHPTLPIPSLVRVTNLENGRTVTVRVNDRGPFVDDRIIDLSKGAGAALDMHAKGTARVRVQYVGAAPLTGGGAVVSTPVAPRRVDVAATNLPPVVRAVAPAPAATLTGQFYVQAGSFADLANAHALRDRLAPNGQVAIETASINGDEFYRVMLGPWTSRDQADDARQRLSRSGAQGLVVARGR